jgi:MFS transporter, DHA2 family, methylenomycin A resistance protein
LILWRRYRVVAGENLPRLLSCYQQRRGCDSAFAALACSVAGEPLWLDETGLVLTGLGMGLNTGPLFGVAVAAVPAARSGSAASLINVARMIGATLGVAILGTAFALAGAGGAGLRAAMLLGGAVQIVGGTVAWRALR